MCTYTYIQLFSLLWLWFWCFDIWCWCVASSCLEIYKLVWFSNFMGNLGACKKAHFPSHCHRNSDSLVWNRAHCPSILQIFVSRFLQVEKMMFCMYWKNNQGNIINNNRESKIVFSRGKIKSLVLNHAQEHIFSEGEYVDLEPVTKIRILRSLLEANNVGRGKNHKSV